MSIVWATAVYRAAEPGVILVTRDGAEKGEPFRGPATGPPGLRHLVPLPWHSAPGSGWDQDETGAWQIRVFRHGEP